jgi:hypothetical protein
VIPHELRQYKQEITNLCERFGFALKSAVCGIRSDGNKIEAPLEAPLEVALDAPLDAPLDDV